MAEPVINSDVDAQSAPPAALLERLLAEVFGTFVLVLGLIGAAMFISGTTGPLAPAFAVGLSVLAAAYAVGHISGGHFNPAVTLGAAMAGRFAWRDVVPYMLAQLVGGAIATSILFAIRSGGPENAAGTFSDVSNGYGTHSPAGYGLTAVIVTEVVLSAVFLWVVLGVTDRRAPTGFAPIAIGLTLTVIHLVSIPISNTSVNPARSIATALYAGGDSLAQLWVFILAPLLGALVAGASYRVLFDRGSRAA